MNTEKMNTNTTEKKTKISEAKRKSNSKYYQNRYASDPDFRARESKRISANTMKLYNSNIDVHEKMKKNALDCYYKLKAIANK